MAHPDSSDYLLKSVTTTESSEPTVSTANSSSYDTDDVSLGEKLIPSILMVILIVGFVGNSLVVYVILKAGHGRVKTATNCYIVNLAITDLCFLFCCVPWTATIYAWNEWKFGLFMCKFVFFMMHVSSLFGVFNVKLGLGEVPYFIFIAKYCSKFKVSKQTSTQTGRYSSRCYLSNPKDGSCNTYLPRYSWPHSTNL